MPDQTDGRFEVTKTGTTDVVVRLDEFGNLHAGGEGVDGDLVLRDETGRQRIRLDAQFGRISMFDADGQQVGSIGQAGNEQTLVLEDYEGNPLVELGRWGNLSLGGATHDGDITIKRQGGEDSIHLDGQEANLWMGGKGADGDVVLFPSDATELNDTAQATLWLNGQDGNMMLGGNGRDGDIAVFPAGATISQSDFSAATIHIDGDSGDITFRNADCAEEFESAEADVEPGTVMVLGDDGRVTPSTDAYDTSVAGVVSGAGDYRPGIVLDKQTGSGTRLPLALMGKVNCKVDASEGPIRVGDMLTSSATPGHAMRATDPTRAFGAVIGKALGSIDDGRGLVPVLVALQ